MAPSPQPPPHYTPGPMNFWDFVNGFNPDATARENQPGMGTDRAPPPPPHPHPHPFSFNFPPGHRAAAPWWTAWTSASDPWAAPAAGEAPPRHHRHDERRHCGRRCRGECEMSESSSDDNNEEAAGPSGEASKEKDADVDGAATRDEKNASPETVRATPDHGGCGRRRDRHHRHRGPSSPLGGPHRHQPHPHSHPHPHHRRHHPGFRPGFNGDAWMATLASHPLAQQLRNYVASTASAGAGAAESRAQGSEAAAAATAATGHNDDGDVDAFTPPVDIFEVRGSGDPNTATASAWVVHVAVPGVKKEDVGVSWEADRGVLHVSGVVYRPGDEEFQRGLVSTERRVGLFTRDVKLPPPQQNRQEGSAAATKEEIDGDGITARLEDGVLVVTVPSHEREWTEVRKVDIL